MAYLRAKFTPSLCLLFSKKEASDEHLARAEVTTRKDVRPPTTSIAEITMEAEAKLGTRNWSAIC